jgi:hypothetical protein
MKLVGNLEYFITRNFMAYRGHMELLLLLFLLLLLLYRPLLGLGRFISFLILYRVGSIPWTGDQPVARPLPTHITTQTQNKCTQYRHPRIEWDPNPRSRRSSDRRLHALDRAATLIGHMELLVKYNMLL